jgi:hypothetical protein
MLTALAIVLSVAALWSLWGYFSSRVEQASYRVVRQTGDYELREYPAHLVAQTTVAGPYDEALGQGFRIVAGYIFGGNVKREGVSMTAPVTAQSAVSERVAMTAPVQAKAEGASYVISFGMPRSQTLETLPMPTDERVKIVEVPAKKFATRRFSWFRTTGRVEKMEEKLLAALSRDHVEVLGAPVYAGYNAPWTPPWLTRHEVMVEVASDQK